MFGNRGRQQQESPTGKIRLPKMTVRPSQAELAQIKQTADDNRGREVESMWAEPGSGKTYCLLVKWAPGPVEPQWTLLEDAGEGTNVVCQYNTIEHELINDVVCMLDKQSGVGPDAQAVGAAIAADVAKQQENKWQSQAAQAANPGAAAQQAQENKWQSQGSQAQGGGAQGYSSGAPQQGYSSGAPQQGFNQGAPQQGFSSGGQQQGFSSPAPQQGFNQSPQGGTPPDPRSFSSSQQSAPAPRIDATFHLPEARQAAAIEGSLDDTTTAKVMQQAVANRATGKLEFCGEETVGEIFYVDGEPKHAATPSAYGDGAIRELVTWEKGTYGFYTDQRTEMRSVQTRQDQLITEGVTMLDQKRHLKRAGLTFDSWLIRKHKQMSEGELKLMLTKGAQIDFNFQKKIYEYLKHKRRFTDLLRDHPMDSTMWTTVLYNFLSCGLIELKAPDAVQGSPLDFLPEAQGELQAINESFVRAETGLYSYAAFLYFMEYEYYRHEAYNQPLSLILFEVQRKRQDGSGGTDMLTGQAANVCAQRIKMIKRGLDTLGHIETLEYGLLLPNTSGSSAAWVANRIYESLTATPLIKDIDRNVLSLAFGIASLPADGDDLQALVLAARTAKHQAKNGSFPVVMSRPARK